MRLGNWLPAEDENLLLAQPRACRCAKFNRSFRALKKKPSRGWRKVSWVSDGPWQAERTSIDFVVLAMSPIRTGMGRFCRQQRNGNAVVAESCVQSPIHQTAREAH